MPRFFVPAADIRDGRFRLSGSEAHHAIHVLRKKVGDTIEIFDGQDASYQARIDSLGAESLTGLLLEKRPAPKTGVQLILYQALLKGPKWDWLIEKVAEVGVATLVPVLSARTIVQAQSDSGAKLERWSRIALAASKQCGRGDVMAVEKPRPLEQALAEASAQALRLMPWEKESERTIRQACHGYQGPTAHLFIGPEGGWEPAEVALAQRQGVAPVSLGPTLLRSETAGIIASARLLAELGRYA